MTSSPHGGRSRSQRDRGARFTGFTLTGAPAGVFTAVGCVGTVIQPGRTCNMTVAFSPPQAITYRGRLNVSGGPNTLGPVTAILNGTGK